MLIHRILPVAALTAALMTAPAVHAKKDYPGIWSSQYPTSLSDNNSGCALCHVSTSGGGLNPYGLDMAAEGSSSNLVAALLAVEGTDSDADPTGSSNIVEIDADTQPGWKVGDDPAGVTGDLDPVTTPPLVADISVSPLSVDFGAVTVGASGADFVAISNAGTADLEVASLTLSGSSEFSLPGAPSTPFTVAPSTSVNVDVEYTPLDEGLDNGTLEIASDSPGEELVSVALSGTGVAVPVDECLPVIDPTSLDYGSIEIGATMTLAATVTNNGTLSCSVDAAVFSSSGEFTLASAAAVTVDPGGSVDVSVDYAPLDVGDDAGNLELTFPDRTIDVPLSGSGFEAAVEVLDLDIKSFRVTKRVSLIRVKPVVIKLTVDNDGMVDGSADATLTGVQNGGVVHEQTLSVTDAVGNGSNRYTLDPFTPDQVGDITWTLVIADEDPDDDVATATTTVLP